MGGAVAALGAVAGGAAGRAVAGKPKTFGPDTSVAGITSATIKKGGKGQPDITVPQVAPNQAVSHFQRGAEVQEKYFRQGLEFYGDALKAAGQEIHEGYLKAEKELTPLSKAGVKALNEQMRFMGMDPVSTSVFAPQQLQQIGDHPELVEKMRAAEELTDPADRAASKAEILQQLDQLRGGTTDPNQRRLLEDLVEDYSLDYSDERERAYTGAEVSEQVRQLPGYEFQMEAGSQAIAAQAAATGMVGSANFPLALQKYGQELGMNFYQQHLQNLQNVAAQGLPATHQLATQEISRSQDLATLAEKGGQAAMGTEQAVGAGYMDAANRIGQTLFETAKFNAAMQMQGIMAEKRLGAGLAQQAIASGPAYQSANTEQALAAMKMSTGLNLPRVTYTSPQFPGYQLNKAGQITGYGGLNLNPQVSGAPKFFT